MRVQGEPAFVLHSRPYRESSAIVDLLTAEHGLLSVVARGIRGTRRRGTRSGHSLVPFSRLSIGCSGRGQLLTLTGVEAVRHHWLAGTALYAGLYVNELSLRLIRHHDPHPELFAGYEQVVAGLSAAGAEIEPPLRRFEKLLLRECGYELRFDRDAETDETVQPEALYRFVPEQGFVRTTATGGGGVVVSGAELHAIDADDYRAPGVRSAAKRIMRRAFAPHLGERGLRSRELFREHGAS